VGENWRFEIPSSSIGSSSSISFQSPSSFFDLHLLPLSSWIPISSFATFTPRMTKP